MRALFAAVSLFLAVAAAASLSAAAPAAPAPAAGHGAQDGHSIRYRRSCAECAEAEFCEYGTVPDGQVACVSYTGLAALYRRYATPADNTDPCDASPCLNGGTCTKVSAAAYICDCPAPWEGDNCEVRIDYCAQNICGVHAAWSVNNCTSSNVSPFFSCNCAPAYDGARCDNQYFSCPSTGNFGDIKRCSNYFSCSVDRSSGALTFIHKLCQRIGPTVQFLWDTTAPAMCRRPTDAVPIPGCA